MDTTLGRSLFKMAVVLSVGAAGGMIGSAALASRAYQTRMESLRRGEQSLCVTGSARKRIESDLAVWSIRVKGKGPDLKTAYKDLNDGVERVKGFLKARSFESNEIGLGSIEIDTEVETRTHYGSEGLKDVSEMKVVKEYLLSRSFTVSCGKLTQVEKAAADVTELIQDGTQVISHPPEYHFTHLSELKLQMLGDAAKDARNRAERIAESAGCHVGEVRQARMGILQITRPDSHEVSDSGIYDTTTIQKDVNAVVSLTFGVEARP